MRLDLPVGGTETDRCSLGARLRGFGGQNGLWLQMLTIFNIIVTICWLCVRSTHWKFKWI